jgi:hypothetical protein
MHASPDYDIISTPVEWRRLEFWLQGYDADARSYLINGFRGGFSLHFSGDPFSVTSQNHASARCNMPALREYVNAESAAGRVAGPFSSPPFDPFVISPLGIVPKKEAGKFRVIHDLSFPVSNSVNAGIMQEDAAVDYETLDRVIELVQLAGRGALIAKVDIEQAFRIIPVCPQDRYLLGFSINGEFFFDKCLPMGCRSSCAIFETFSRSLQWVARSKLSIPYISHILDDFIFVGPPDSNICALSLDAFLLLCADCSIPIKHAKTVLPATCVAAHGIELDTIAMQARLPEEKLNKARTLLQRYSSKTRISLRELQSLIGFLTFACRVIQPGRAFLRRLISLTYAVTNPRHHITLNSGARADMKAWLSFLVQFNGTTLFPEPSFSSSDTLQLYSDASGALGFAAVFGTRWFCDEWPAEFAPLHITVKELFPIVLMTEIWGPLFANRRILFHTDNMAVMHIINKQTSRHAETMILVRRFVVASLKYNFVFKAAHIPGKTNVVADHLSRFSFQAARQAAPWLETTPTQVPDHLMCLASSALPRA